MGNRVVVEPRRQQRLVLASIRPFDGAGGPCVRVFMGSLVFRRRSENMVGPLLMRSGSRSCTTRRHRNMRCAGLRSIRGRSLGDTPCSMLTPALCVVSGILAIKGVAGMPRPTWHGADHLRQASAISRPV